MSLQSWKDEFYPTPAESTTKAEAVAHSLRKWEGLRLANLQRRKITSFIGTLICKETRDTLSIDGGSCALCHHHNVDGGDEDERPKCNGCPLYESRGQVECDEVGLDEDGEETGAEDVFHCFTSGGDPEPMIEALKKAAEWESNE